MKALRELFEKVRGRVIVKIPEEKEEEKYIEIKPSKPTKVAKVKIRKFALAEFSDLKGVLDSIREGSTIALVHIRPLREKDVEELKRCVDKLKRTIAAMEGEVVGIDENWLIAVPSFVEIQTE